MPFSTQTKILLAGLAAAIAIVLAWDLPRQSTEPAPPPEPAPAPPPPEVRRGLDKTPLLYAGEYLRNLSDRLSRSVALAWPELDGNVPPVPGFVVSDLGEVAIALAGSASRWRVIVAGAESEAVLIGADPVHGVALLQTDLAVPARALEPSREAAIRPGDPLVGIRAGPVQSEIRLLMSPGPAAILRDRLEDDGLTAGEVVVNLDGQLVAFMGGVRGERGKPLPVALLSEIVGALRTGGRHPHPWIGVDLQTIDAALRRHFTEGALVAVHVEAGSPAAAAGIRAGMSFDEVQADSDVIARSAEELETLLPGASELRFVPARDGARPIRVEVGDWQVAPGFAPADSLLPEVAAPGVPVRVNPASRAAAQGLRTGDVVERIDGRPVRTARDLTRVLTAPEGRLLTVRRDQRRFYLALASEEEEE